MLWKLLQNGPNFRYSSRSAYFIGLFSSHWNHVEKLQTRYNLCSSQNLIESTLTLPNKNGPFFQEDFLFASLVSSGWYGGTCWKPRYYKWSCIPVDHKRVRTPLLGLEKGPMRRRGVGHGHAVEKKNVR